MAGTSPAMTGNVPRLELPASLSTPSYEDMKAWLELVLRASKTFRQTRPPTEAALFFVLAQDLAGRRIHQMDPLARRAGHGLIGIAIRRNFVSNESLNTIARTRAAIDEWRDKPS